MALTLRSILQCPHCGFKVVEQLPAGAAPKTYACPACGKTVRLRGACCIFCDYGSVPCVRAQQQQSQQ